MKGNPRKQLWMSFGIVFGVVVVASVALYFLLSDLDAQAARIVSDKALVAQRVAVVSALASLKSDAVQAAQYADAMNKLLPSHDELIGFPQWIASAGQEHNVSVSIVFRGNNTVATNALPGSDGFSLGASGAATDIVAFLSDLETRSAGFLLSIDSFDLTSNGSSYQLSAQGRVFSK
ncbi:MAG: hypothetical protein ABSC29_01825 [Minisyncoccia bacterium]|jgi:Tfp pilus assembly protein PilO